MKLANKDAPALKIRPGRSGSLRMSGNAVTQAAEPVHRREFIDRCFAVPTLLTFRLSADASTVDLRFQPGKATLPETLDALAAAMRTDDPGEWPLANERAVFAACAGRPVEIHRLEQRLTFWHIDAVGAEYYRCTHPLMRSDGIRDQVLEDLATLAGVEEESASPWLADCLLVHAQPHKVTAGHLLDVLEPSLERALARRQSPVDEVFARRAFLDANLALAFVSDFVVPAVGFANAVFSTVLNYRNVGHAYRSLKSGAFSLSTLHSTMYGMGLIAFEWIGDAVLSWSTEFWQRQVARLRRQSERQFMARYRRYPRRVRVERDGAQIEIALSDLQRGEIVILRHGDIVPGDGVVVAGRGAVLESWITGQEGLVPKKARDVLYASTELSEGELHMKIQASGAGTVAARLAAWFEEVLKQPHPRSRAGDFGETMALPTFLLSMASLHRGGIAMAKAVGHPDFRSGPGIAAELSDLAATLQAGLLGVYVSSPEALTRIGEADCFIVDDSAAAWTAQVAPDGTVGDRLRALGVREFVLLSHRPAAEISSLAQKMGADIFLGRQSAVHKTGFIEQRRLLDRKVVYIGDVGLDAAAAAAAEIAVAVAGPNGAALPKAAVVLRQPDLEKCVLLRMMALKSLEIQKSGMQTALAFNISCMFGALFLNFPILAVVGLTNFGTYVTYRRATGVLSGLEETVDEA